MNDDVDSTHAPAPGPSSSAGDNASGLIYRLESWLQFRYGPRAALHSRPCFELSWRSTSEHAPYTWLRINAPGTGAPTTAGIRLLRSTPHTIYEITEWLLGREVRRSVWHCDPLVCWRLVNSEG